MARPRGRPRRLDLPVVAQLARRGRMLVAEPFFEAGGPRVEVPRGSGREGDLVLVGFGKRGAKVLRPIGRPDIARDVVEALMVDRGLRRSFPRRAETEALEAVARLGPATSAGAGEGAAAGERPQPGGDGRADLRSLPTFTVDPDDARDFDDAISAEPRDDGTVRLWVHIADVTAFVRPGGRLDGEALRRGTSTYVPGAVEPMLPEQISNGACSLRPGEDRLAVTVELDMAGVEVRRVAFHRSWIRSDRRLTYGEVDAILAGRARAEEPWGPALAAARGVAADLHERRRRRGGLEVESSEPRFAFDRDGGVAAVEREPQTESHTLIEELMILANEQVAGHLAQRRLPTLYRVHERPDPLAVEAMVAKLAALEVPVPAVPARMSPQQAADVAAEASRLAAGYARRHGRGRQAFGSLVLRSLKQAYYSPRNAGHAGLASASYCHFTSPIRRYPDIVAHRALLAGLGIDDAAPRVHELDELGTVCSEAERAAMKVERDADDVCLAFLLERRLAEAGGRGRGGGASPPIPSPTGHGSAGGAGGASPPIPSPTGHGSAGGAGGLSPPIPIWEGEVVGLISKGWFVRFGEEGFEGFLPVRRMSGWYEPDEHESALVDVRSGRALRIGDPVAVTVARIETHRGRVDLEPAV